MLSLPPPPSMLKTIKNDEFLRLQARNPSMPIKPGGRTCITCHGAGSFTWFELGQRDRIAQYVCPCTDQWLLHTSLLNANVGLMYQRLSWDDMTSTDPQALADVKSYLGHADQFVHGGIGMILFGKMGTGKTSLLALVIKDLLARGHDGYFTTFSEMIDTYTGGWNDRDEKVWFHKRIKNVPVLAIDDVGREHQGRTKSGLPEATFDEVLRHRIAAGSVTFLSTNKALSEVAEGYGGNVMSLLHERSATYEFTGEDYRDNARMRGLAEISAGLVRPVTIT